MSYNIAYYVHHHGSGHLMRALAIASALDRPVTFLGSGLNPCKNLIPETIKCVHLPMDIADADDTNYHAGNEVGALHYAPLNVKGIRERNRILTNFFSSHYPLVLIVDVSVEVALLARLCSIPTIIIRQHGHRNDTAHLAAYESATLLIAPYARELQTGSLPWVDDKTFFAGGFSKYTGKQLSPAWIDANLVAVMCGKGGTSITLDFLKHLAGTCPGYHFFSVGEIAAQVNELPANLTLCGNMEEPVNILRNAAVVIGNAGHNTVMEVADLKRPFICIPEDRPFDEQMHKAGAINSAYGISMVLPENIFETNWNSLLNRTLCSQPDWHGMINDQALKGINVAINKVASKQFKAPVA